MEEESGAFDALADRTTTAAKRSLLDVEKPFDGTVLGRVPHSIPTDVTVAVGRARAAQIEWATWPVAKRAAVLLRFHDRLLETQSEILDIIQLESGKARRHAYEEILDICTVARYYAHAGAEFLKMRRRQGAMPFFTQAWEYRHPKGVVGIISPWNYPLTLGIGDALPALLAGNGVVAKPDERTPLAALWAARTLDECGLPSDVLQIVTGFGAELGPTIVDQCDFVMFTGSTAVGREVAAQAGRRLIECSMELGGKNAMLVLDDADIDKAVDGAVRAAFSNTGQLCISIERMYVDRAIWDRFLPRFVGATRALRLGAALDYSVDIGSLASAKQLTTVQRHVDDALSKGATILAGGRARPDIGPYFYEPTILTDVTPDCLAYGAETFGPVVSLYRVDGVDEAVERANDSPYGLNFSVWTGDSHRGRAVAARLQAGTVNINEAYASAWGSVDAPMGGMKASGIGRRHGEHGITKYTDSQTVAAQRILPLAPPPFLSAAQYASVMNVALRVLRRLPGYK